MAETAKTAGSGFGLQIRPLQVKSKFGHNALYHFCLLKNRLLPEFTFYRGFLTNQLFNQKVNIPQQPIMHIMPSLPCRPVVLR